MGLARLLENQYLPSKQLFFSTFPQFTNAKTFIVHGLANQANSRSIDVGREKAQLAPAGKYGIFSTRKKR
jgi:hypothetical protein